MAHGIIEFVGSGAWRLWFQAFRRLGLLVSRGVGVVLCIKRFEVRVVLSDELSIVVRVFEQVFSRSFKWLGRNCDYHGLHTCKIVRFVNNEHHSDSWCALAKVDTLPLSVEFASAALQRFTFIVSGVL
jgi:hypothetical protein